MFGCDKLISTFRSQNLTGFELFIVVELLARRMRYLTP